MSRRIQHRHIAGSLNRERAKSWNDVLSWLGWLILVGIFCRQLHQWSTVKGIAHICVLRRLCSLCFLASQLLHLWNTRIGIIILQSRMKIPTKISQPRRWTYMKCEHNFRVASALSRWNCGHWEKVLHYIESFNKVEGVETLLRLHDWRNKSYRLTYFGWNFSCHALDMISNSLRGISFDIDEHFE